MSDQDLEYDVAEVPDLFLFLASTAHDMKNSISVLCCTLENLLAEATPAASPADPKIAQMAQMLYESKRLNNNLIQLLALYKKVGKAEYPFDCQSQQLDDFALHVQAQCRVLLNSKGIELDVVLPPDLVWYFDEDLIVGVIGHAINNATHYTLNKVRLIFIEDGDYLEIRVEDNGRGYPPAMLEMGNAGLNEVRSGVNFATSSTGLGLYFSSEVAKMHKNRGRVGTVRLENGGSLGGGCFVLRLP
jgi:signal transduction histidine kinase